MKSRYKVNYNGNVIDNITSAHVDSSIQNEVFKELNELSDILEAQKYLVLNSDRKLSEFIAKDIQPIFKDRIETIDYIIEHPTSKFNRNNGAYKQKVKALEKMKQLTLKHSETRK